LKYGSLRATGRNDKDEIEVFVDAGNTLFRKRDVAPHTDQWDVTWSPLGGPGKDKKISGLLAVGKNPDGTLVVLATDSDGALWHMTSGKGDGVWLPVHGPIFTHPYRNWKNVAIIADSKHKP
jgi:hypothetical protein